MSNDELMSFFTKLDKALTKGEKTVLKRNHALFKDAEYETVLAFFKCIPKESYINVSEYQNLFFAATVCCELGFSNQAINPKDAVAKVLASMRTGDTRFSELLQQSTKTGSIYPLMRRYLSMYKEPVDVVALYYDLASWDQESVRGDLESHKFNLPVKYRWAKAYAIQSK